MKRKIVSLLLAFLSLFMAAFAACEKEIGSPAWFGLEVVSVTETEVVLRGVGNSNGRLSEGMELLKEDGKLTYEILGGMVTSINGKANGSNEFWMLYTSDEEMANTAWGTYEYNGETLGSAIVGAEALLTVNGEIYIWAYQSF